MYHESGWLTVSIAGRGGEFDSYFGRFKVVEIREERGDVTGLLNHLIVAGSLPELLNADAATPVPGERRRPRPRQ